MRSYLEVAFQYTSWCGSDTTYILSSYHFGIVVCTSQMSRENGGEVHASGCRYHS